MRAILILGVMLMPWLDDMKALSAALTEQASLPQRGKPLPWQSQSRGMRGDLMDGIEKGTQPHPYFDLNQKAKEWQSLFGQVETGRLTMEEAQRIYRQRWPAPEPPPEQPIAPRKGLPGLNNPWDR